MRRCIPFAISVILFLFPAFSDARVVTDEVGRKVNVPDRPTRIVSLAPNITETLFALGCDDEIVGVTVHCNYPEAALSKECVGDLIHPSLEKIVSLEPDLVICTADGNRKETAVLLEKMGVPVYVVNPRTLREIIDMILHIGIMTGKEHEAVDLAESLGKRIERVAQRAGPLPKPRVFFQFGTEGLITAGRGTFINELISCAGGVNIAGDASIRYPRFSIEEIVDQGPDFIFVTSMKNNESPARAKASWQRWHIIPAVRYNKIYLIDSDYLTRPSPRIIDGLEHLFRIMHPDGTTGVVIDK